MNVIVTGGSGDIGGACARLLTARGDDVLIVDSDGVAAELLASEINEGTKGRARAQTADVALADDVRVYVARAVDAWASSMVSCMLPGSRARPRLCRSSTRRSSTA